VGKPKAEEAAEQTMKASQLHITWDDRHREFILWQLAKLEKVLDVTDATLKEFGVEWKLETETEKGRERVSKVRLWVYDRVRFFAYDKRNKKHQARILEMRRRFRNQIRDNIPLANKANRILEYVKLKDLCVKIGNYHAAIRALNSIALEMGDLKTPAVQVGDTYNMTVNQETVMQLNQQNVGRLTEGQIDEAIERLLLQAGVPSRTARSFVRVLNNRNGSNGSAGGEGTSR
jgi:hypothetical protein